MPRLALSALTSIMLPLLGATLLFGQDAEATWSARDHIPLDEFVVQSHRGAGILSEENTRQAFELGWKLNTIPEADVRTTADGVFVPFHDSNFSRLVKDAGPELAKQGVEDVTFAELSRLDVGSWKGEEFADRHVPRLSDIFDLMRGHPDRRLYLDLKQVDLEQLARAVRQAGVEHQVILASTKYDQLRHWKSLLPQAKTLLWMGGAEAELNQRFEKLRKTGFADLTQVQIHVHLKGDAQAVRPDSQDPFQESDAFLIARGEELRDHDILFQTLPYGGSTPEIYRKLLNLGVMSFATDHPRATWKAIRQYYGQQ